MFADTILSTFVNVFRKACRLVCQYILALLLRLDAMLAGGETAAKLQTPSKKIIPEGFASRQNRIGIVGAPHWQGQPVTGTDLAPKVLRHFADLKTTLGKKGFDVKEFGDIAVPTFDEDVPFWSAGQHASVQHPKIVGEFSRQLAIAVGEIFSDNRRLVNLGGDHSTALGSIYGHAKYMDTIYKHPSDGASLCVLWIDAHADINTTFSTETGNLHGCPLSFLVHELSDPKIQDIPGHDWVEPVIYAKRLAYIGLRNVESGENDILERLGIPAYSMRDIDDLGIKKCFALAMESINPDGTLPLHVSFDIDSLDSLEAPSTGTPESGGLSLREASQLVSVIRESNLLTGFDLCEVNPSIGTVAEQKRTLTAATKLIRGVFGSARMGPWPLARELPEYHFDKGGVDDKLN